MNRNQASMILLLGLGAIILGLGWSGRLSAAWTALTQGPSAVPPLKPSTTFPYFPEDAQIAPNADGSCQEGYTPFTDGARRVCVRDDVLQEWMDSFQGNESGNAAGQAQHITYLPTGAWDIRPAPNGTL